MKIWVDMTNSPHVLFFKPIMDELGKEHDIIVSARDYQQTLPLLDRYRIDYVLLGKHYGKCWIRKFFGSIREVFLRLAFILRVKPDLVITHHSFYATLAAFFTNNKSLYIFDGDASHIQMAGIIFASKSLCPEAIKKNRISKPESRPRNQLGLFATTTIGIKTKS